MRKLFYTSDNHPILAAGCILLRNRKEMLMIHNKWSNQWEDLGGRTDSEDETVYHTIQREVAEESNQKLQLDIERIKSGEFLYFPYSKYMICLLDATETESKYEADYFGMMEEHDCIPRTIEWVDISNMYECVMNKKLFVHSTGSLKLYQMPYLSGEILVHPRCRHTMLWDSLYYYIQVKKE